MIDGITFPVMQEITFNKMWNRLVLYGTNKVSLFQWMIA